MYFTENTRKCAFPLDVADQELRLWKRLSANTVSQLERWSFIDEFLQYLKNLEVDHKKVALGGTVESLWITYVGEKQ